MHQGRRVLKRMMFWSTVMLVGGGLGLIFGLAPYLIVGALSGAGPALTMGEVEAVLVLFAMPSACIFLAMTRMFGHRSLTASLACGFAWPFVTLWIGIALNRVLVVQSDLSIHLAVLSYVLVFPLGGTAGLVLHRLDHVYAQYHWSPAPASAASPSRSVE